MIFGCLFFMQKKCIVLAKQPLGDASAAENLSSNLEVKS